MEELLAHRDCQLITRENLAGIPAPDSTDTFKPVPHIELVNTVVDGLAYRHISVVRDQYAVSDDGMKLFGVLELDNGFEGGRFSLGIRNANDKSMRLAMTVGFRVFVCDNLAFHGDFTPVLHKHTKNFIIADALAIGIDRMQRNFEPMRADIQKWRQAQLTDGDAKLVIYKAFVEGNLDAPRHLARRVHELYFNPQHQEFASRTIWSLNNAFTSAFKDLEPIPQFKATAKLGEFFAALK